MDQIKSEVLVGRVSGAFGIRGWLKVSSYTEPAENIFAYTPWRLRGRKSTQRVELLKAKSHGKGLIVQIDGIDDRDKANDLKGMEIVVDRDQLPELAAGHYYWKDLEGLQVETAKGRVLGHVDHLIEAGAADVMVVSGEERHLIPFVVDDIVLSVDMVAGCIRVNWEADGQDD